MQRQKKSTSGAPGFLFVFFRKTALFLFFYILTTGVILYIKFSASIESAKKSDRALLEIKKQWFEQMMKSVASDLNFIVSMPATKNYLLNRNGFEHAEIEKNLVALANTRGHFSIIKVLDESGNGRIGVQNSDQAYPLKAGDLGNDSQEPYFTKSRYHAFGKIFVSEPVLLTKNGIAEIPARPVISVSTPLYNRYETFSGVAVIILDGAKIFEKLKDSALAGQDPFSVYTSKGFPLIGGKWESDWNNILKYHSEENLSAKNPGLWSLMSQKNEGEETNDGYLIFKSLFVPGTIWADSLAGPENIQEQNLYLKISREKPEKQIQDQLLIILKKDLGIAGFMFCLVLGLSGYYSRIVYSRRRQSEHLVNLKHHYEQTQKLSGTGSWWFDVLLNQYWWSTGVYEILECSGETMDTTLPSIYNLIHPEDSGVIEKFERSLKYFLPHNEIFRIILPGGKIKHIQSSVSAEFDGKNPVRINGTFHDVTILKNAEENFRNLKSAADISNEAKTEYVTSLTNEIRDTMEIILTFAESADNDVHNTAGKISFRNISASTRFLIGTCNDILELSKQEMGQIRTVNNSVNIQGLINDIRQGFQLKLEKKSLNFFIDVDPDIPPGLMTNSVAMRQILLNLISNAIKFTGRGFVLVTCRKKFRGIEKKQLDLQITVEDTGIQFSERGYSLNLEGPTSKDSSEEFFYNMGFAVTRRLVYLMNGNLEIISEPGKGCVVKINIPGLEVSGTPAKKPGPVAEDSFIENISFEDFSTSRILLAGTTDDRVVLKHYFLEGDFNILESPIDRGLSKIAELELPDIIIAIISEVPSDMDFFQDRIKNHHSDQIPLAIIIPEASMTGSVFALIKKAADEILFLPLRKHELLLVLARYLSFQEPAEASKAILDLGGITDEAKSRLSGLLNILHNKLGHLWEKVSTLLVKKDLDEFVGEVIELGRKYNYRPLYKWGNELRDKIQINDTLLIVETLKEYPVILENLAQYDRSENN